MKLLRPKIEPSKNMFYYFLVPTDPQNYMAAVVDSYSLEEAAARLLRLVRPYYFIKKFLLMFINPEFSYGETMTHPSLVEASFYSGNPWKDNSFWDGCARAVEYKSTPETGVRLFMNHRGLSEKEYIDFVWVDHCYEAV